MSSAPDVARRPTFGRFAFFSRRVAALGTSAYFGFYLTGLVGDGRRMPLGDVGRAHPLLRWLEIFLIALVTFHAASSVAIWIVERTQTARHHRIAFGLSLGMAVTVGLLHVVWLFDKP